MNQDQYYEQLMTRFNADSSTKPIKEYVKTYAGSLANNPNDGSPVHLALRSLMGFKQAFIWIFTKKYWYIFEHSATKILWENCYVVPMELAVTSRAWGESLQVFGDDSFLLILEKLGSHETAIRAADILNSLSGERVEENQDLPLASIYLGHIENVEGISGMSINQPASLVIFREFIKIGNFNGNLVQLPISSIIDIEIGGPGVYQPPVQQQSSGGGYGFMVGF